MSLNALKTMIVAGDAAGAVALLERSSDRDALLDAVIGALSRGAGVPWELSWRVKREALPAALSVIARIVARHWDRAPVAPLRDAAHTLLAPRDWLAHPEVRRALGDRVLALEVGPERLVGLVRVPAGRFSMGRSAGEVAGGYQEAADQREVAITRDYWLGATPVTRAEWAAVMTPQKAAGDDRPVVVRWREALAFCNALSRAAGLPEAYALDDTARAGFEGPSALGYRLPTEAEWEHAARAGTTTATYNGDLKNHYGKNAVLDPIAWYGGAGAVRPTVAQKLPNAHGLYDMLGLAWELCFDRYSALPDGPLEDPIGDTSPLPPGGRDTRVVRGGDGGGFASLCRASTRLGDNEGAFRVCRTASEPRPEVRIPRVELRAKPKLAALDAVLDLRHGRPQRLRAAQGRLFVGTAGGLTAPQLHELVVLDAGGAVAHRWPTRFLVSDLAVTGERVWLSLGPGYLDVSDGLGASRPREHAHYVNAPVLATLDDALIVGERFGSVHVHGALLGGVRKWLYDVAADADRVYAAYEDGKCRVFDRATGTRLRKMPSSGRSSAQIACARGALFLADRGGEIARFDAATLEKTASWQDEPVARGAGIPRLQIDGEHVVRVSPSGVRMYDFHGALVSRWACEVPDMHVSDALVLGDHLVVALGHGKRAEGAIVRVPRA